MHRRGIHSLIVTKSDMVAGLDLDPALDHVQITITSTDDGPNPLGERAPAPSKRMAAVRDLVCMGIDVQVRMSPYVPELVDLGRLRELTGCGRVVVEFMRGNGPIRRAVPIDWSRHTLRLGGYRHLPLRTKRAMLAPVMDAFEEVSVCEDVYSHWSVWRNEVNHNPLDCCNLRGVACR